MTILKHALLALLVLSALTACTRREESDAFMQSPAIVDQAIA